LKASIPNAEKLIEIKPLIDQLYAEKKELRSKLNAFQETIDGQDKEIDHVKKEMEDAKEQR